MGTPDSISSTLDVQTGLAHLGLVCPSAHVLTKFQTKDLEEALLQYCLAIDADDSDVVRLYGPMRKESSTTYEVSVGLEEITRSFYPRTNHTGAVLCSTTCDKCLPIFYESQVVWHNGIGERELFFEVDMWFEKGVLVRAEVSGLSREEKRAQMLKDDGVFVLPDDDRLVKRRIKELLEEKK